MILNELRQGLVNARLESLATEGVVIAKVIDQYATLGDPQPRLEADSAGAVLHTLAVPSSQRARLFDARGYLLADTWTLAGRIEARQLPATRQGGRLSLGMNRFAPSPAQRLTVARAGLSREITTALSGNAVTNMRLTEDGRQVVSVSIPIQHVRAVVGVLTLEAGDVQQIISDQRRALVPFIVIAVGVSLFSSFLLTQLIADPVMRLARAADHVRLSRARAIALPDLAARTDELGDLARSLEDMTQSLSDRMEATERFAADVAHELRNPMTSIRSAVETLELVTAAVPRKRLLSILEQDVGRLERLITDISNASRLDAELSRAAPRPMNLSRLVTDICGLYEATARPTDVHVRFLAPHGEQALRVLGREGPISQVIRNLIDNGRSFSAGGGEVRVSLERVKDEIIVIVDDDGPGVPPENLETIFERFYTSRPKGVAFGGNSGLGLAIARQIIDAHSGRIWAQNRMMADTIVGARFLFALPAA